MYSRLNDNSLVGSEFTKEVKKKPQGKKSALTIPLETYYDISFFKLREIILCSDIFHIIQYTHVLIASYKSLSRFIGRPLYPCCMVGRTVGGGKGLAV